MKNTNYKNYLELVKVISCILLVLAPSTRMFTPLKAINTNINSQNLTIFTELIYSFHMPLFIATSGSIFFLAENYNPADMHFIKKKLKRLIIPFLGFSLFYCLPIMNFLGLIPSIKIFLIENILLFIGPAHLWYLPMLFFTLIIFKGLRKYIDSTNPCFLFGILILLHFCSYRLPYYFQIRGVAHYMIFFYSGYIIEKEKLIKRIQNPFFTSLFFLIILTVSFYLSMEIVKIFPLTKAIFRIITGISGTIIFYILADFAGDKIGNIKKASGYSFGIYLFHPMILYVLYNSVKVYDLSPIPISILFTIIALLLSVAFTFLTRKLGLKIILGE